MTSAVNEGMARNTNPFEYNGMNLQDHYGANFWSADQGPGGPESGVDANRAINNDYSQLSRVADEYMRGGVDAPTINNFFENAEQASTEVGRQINNIENSQRGLNGSATGLVDAGRNMANLRQMDQVGRVFDATMQAEANDVVQQNPNGGDLENGARVLGGTAGRMVGELDTTRDALVNGNTAIHRQLGPAADTFFKGEADGGKGIEALKKAGIYPGSDKDPDGLITRAFSSMRETRDLAQQWKDAKTPEERQKIQDKRLKAGKDSMFSFMMHEQGHILQNPQIFDDPVMKRNLKAITPTMQFKDTNKTWGQLGQGQDYSNFQQRLGVNKVDADTPGAFPLTKNGQTQHYMPDPTQKGSIVDYFSQNMEGPGARRMIDAPAAPVDAGPQHQSTKGLREAAQGIDNGDLSSVASGGVRTAGGLASDSMQGAGNAIEGAGESMMIDASNQMARGGVGNQVAGTAKAVTGVVMDKGGEALDTAGQLVEAGTDAVADHTKDVVKSYDNGVVAPWDPNAKWWIGRNPFRQGGLFNW